jgi:uncharacterized SAM-binding protein YcdF (DUF218 family)
MQPENLPEAGTGTRRSCLKFFGGCTGLTLAGLVGLVLLYALLVGMGHYLVVSDPLHQADAIVVLSGDSGGRMVETAALFKEQLAEVVILTQTDQPSDNGEIETPSNQAKRLDALDQGIPSDALLFTTVKSSSTVDEAKAVLSLMNDKNWTSCIIVTDPFHSRRTRTIFSDVFKGSGIKVMVHPVSNSWYHASTWFFSRLGWNTTFLEYAKYFSYLAGIKGD